MADQATALCGSAGCGGVDFGLGLSLAGVPSIATEIVYRVAPVYSDSATATAVGQSLDELDQADTFDALLTKFLNADGTVSVQGLVSVAEPAMLGQAFEASEMTGLGFMQMLGAVFNRVRDSVLAGRLSYFSLGGWAVHVTVLPGSPGAITDQCIEATLTSSAALGDLLEGAGVGETILMPTLAEAVAPLLAARLLNVTAQFCFNEQALQLSGLLRVEQSLTDFILVATLVDDGTAHGFWRCSFHLSLTPLLTVLATSLGNVLEGFELPTEAVVVVQTEVVEHLLNSSRIKVGTKLAMDVAADIADSAQFFYGELFCSLPSCSMFDIIASMAGDPEVMRMVSSSGGMRQMVAECDAVAASVCTFKPGDGQSNREVLIQQTASESECFLLVRRLHPSANGATYGVSGSGDQNCYAEYVQYSRLRKQTAYTTCMFAPAAACVFHDGDNSGGIEEHVGDAYHHNECLQLVRAQRPHANGATFEKDRDASGRGQCFAETAATGETASSSWQTCRFEPDDRPGCKAWMNLEGGNPGTARTIVNPLNGKEVQVLGGLGIYIPSFSYMGLNGFADVAIAARSGRIIAQLQGPLVPPGTCLAFGSTEDFVSLHLEYTQARPRPKLLSVSECHYTAVFSTASAAVSNVSMPSFPLKFTTYESSITAFASCFHCLRGEDTAFALCVTCLGG